MRSPPFPLRLPDARNQLLDSIIICIKLEYIFTADQSLAQRIDQLSPHARVRKLSPAKSNDIPFPPRLDLNFPCCQESIENMVHRVQQQWGDLRHLSE